MATAPRKLMDIFNPDSIKDAYHDHNMTPTYDLWTSGDGICCPLSMLAIIQNNWTIADIEALLAEGRKKGTEDHESFAKALNIIDPDELFTFLRYYDNDEYELNLYYDIHVPNVTNPIALAAMNMRTWTDTYKDPNEEP